MYKQFQIIYKVKGSEGLQVVYSDTEEDAIYVINRIVSEGSTIEHAMKMKIEKVYQSDGFKVV